MASSCLIKRQDEYIGTPTFCSFPKENWLRIPPTMKTKWGSFKWNHFPAVFNKWFGSPPKMKTHKSNTSLLAKQICIHHCLLLVARTKSLSHSPKIKKKRVPSKVTQNQSCSSLLTSLYTSKRKIGKKEEFKTPGLNNLDSKQCITSVLFVMFHRMPWGWSDFPVIENNS